MGELRRGPAVFLGLIMSFLQTAEASNTPSCPTNLPIEFGQRSLLNCSLGVDYVDVFWFRGTAAADNLPILWLEDDGPGGPGYESGEYDVSPEGWLVITNPQLNHDGEYTVRVFDNGGSRKDASTRVDVYILPEPLCPTISHCQGCGECHDVVNVTGEVVCSISGARPLVNITWAVTNQSGVISTIESPIHYQDGVTGTWDSSASILYDIDHCGGFAILQCTASSIAPLLNPVRKITVRSPVQCNSPPPLIPTAAASVDPGGQPMTVLPIVVLTVGVAGIFLTLTCMIRSYCRYREERSPSVNVAHDRTDPENGSILLEPTSLRTTEKKHRRYKDRREDISQGLREAYGKLLYTKPLPWDEAIHMKVLYTSCQCIITSTKGTIGASTDYLFTDKFTSNNKRVLVIASLGFGKTTLTKHVVDRWMSGKKDTFLFIVSLRDVRRNTELAMAVLDKLPPGIEVNQHDINAILEEEPCHILLDGLDELSMSAGDKNLVETKSRSNSVLTIDDLLKNNVPYTYKKTRVWVTSRAIDDMANPFEQPFAKVELKGFSDDQVKEYVRKACAYHEQLRRSLESNTNIVTTGRTEQVPVEDEDSREVTESKAKPRNKKDGCIDATTKNHRAEASPLSGTEENVISDTLDESKAPNVPDSFENSVKQYLKLNEIAHVFSATPLLIVMVIHIIASKISDPLGKMKNVNIDKLTNIVRMMTTCLEARYVEKRRGFPLKETLHELEQQLGKIAFAHQMGVTLRRREEWDERIGGEYVDMALAIGLLCLSKDLSGETGDLLSLATSSYTGIEFYHQYFQEFLAAQYVPAGQEKKMLDSYLKKCEDREAIRYLQFMTVNPKDELSDLWYGLLESQEMWNNLIDCLYEDEDYDRVRKVITEIGSRRQASGINVHYLEKEYHRRAFASFCTMCRENDVIIGSITFREQCATEFMSRCRLPKLGRLEFVGVDVGEEEFVGIIEQASVVERQMRQVSTLNFIECKLPGSVTGTQLERIKTAIAGKENKGKDSLKRLKIYREAKTEGKICFECFNPGKGTWRKS